MASGRDSGPRPPIVEANDVASWVLSRAAGVERFILGIAGAPGSGKSTVASQLAIDVDAVVVPMDGFHLLNDELDRRGLRGVKGAPQTFDADGFLHAVRAIRRGGGVMLPDFDRVLDAPRSNRVRVPASASIVIIEGNYLLLDSEPWRDLRSEFDAVAHLDIDAAVRVQRLIDRHLRFGKSPADAAEFVATSDEPNAALVEAARGRAHLIVRAR